MHKESGTCDLRPARYSYGSVTELSKKERDGHILLGSIQIDFYGEELTPTQYDSHGNPQFSGLANKILSCKIRQKVREGVIDSYYRAQVTYSYKVHPYPRKRSIPGPRLPDPFTCQVCHGPIYHYHLDAYGDDGVEEIGDQHTVVHAECVREYYRLTMTDELTETVGRAFGCYNISDDAEQHLSWGKGADSLSYEPIPNEYCPYPGCCPHNPWFLFHTPYGSIKIGWGRSIISISFLSDFTEFDPHIFDGETVTKFARDGEYTIHANDYGKLHDYLEKVRKDILSRKK